MHPFKLPTFEPHPCRRPCGLTVGRATYEPGWRWSEHVGLSERDAQRQGVTARVARLPINAAPRAQTIGETQGFMKALLGTNDDRILCFTMIGPEAGEVVAVVQTAMLSDIAYSKLHDAVITHPTMAEALNMLFSNVPPRDASR